MEKYSPQFSLTPKMLMLVSSVSELLGKVSVSLVPAEKKHLLQGMIKRSVCASLQTGGNPVTVYDLEGLDTALPLLATESDVLEVKNAISAYALAYKTDGFSLKDFKTVHSVMMCGMPERHGGFRTGESAYSAFRAQDVPVAMEELFTWLNDGKKLLHPLVLSSVCHHEILRICPFADGNGRMARFWQKLLLMAWDPVFEYVPFEIRIEKFRTDYYTAVESCIRDGNAVQFIEFMAVLVQEAFCGFYSQVRSEGIGVSMAVRRLLGVMELDVPYTASELMGRLGLRSREAFRKNYLRPAMALSRVEMTLPERPRSRNQRYIRAAGRI